jgi:ParB/RepB/Spo0J family partition protein
MTTTTATKKKQTNGAAKAKPIERRVLPPKPVPKRVAPASEPPPSTPIEMDVAHERRPLGSVWRERRSNIRRSQTNPRTVFVLDDLIETMEVRAEDGTRTKRQLSPILVRFRPDTDSDTDYEIIFGERRDRAAEALGWDDIEVKLVEMSDDEVEEVQLVENLSRADMTPLDEAHAFQRMEHKGYSVQQIGDRVGKREPYIRQRLALARLVDEAKAALRDGAISVGAAQELAAVTDPNAQRSVVARALEGRAPGADPMSAKQIRMFVEQAMLVLSRAKFALDDATLVPAAGACSSCPKRSSQQFALLALTGAGDDERCTDRSCFTAKQEAYWTRVAAEARAAGQTVIEGDAARKVLAFGGVAKDSGYVDWDAHCAELRDGRTWREVLGDDALPVSLVRAAEGASHRIVPKADAVRLLRERGLLRTPGAPAQAPAAATRPANDATADDGSERGPDTVPPSTPEPTLLTPDQIAKAAKRARLDSATFTALMEAAIVALEPADVEVVDICKPYDVPVPRDAEGHDVVIGVARGLTNDGERFALLARVCCAISQKARTRLSEYFAPKPGDIDAAIEAAKVRALHAIRTGARKPAQIRAAAGIAEDLWEKVGPALEASGLVRVEGRARGRQYFAVTSEEPATTDPDTAADGEPDGLAASEVERSIRDNVRDLLRSAALQRTELASRLADIEGMPESDADREVEQLIREGFLLDNGECVEWADGRDPTPFDYEPGNDAPRVVF